MIKGKQPAGLKPAGCFLRRHLFIRYFSDIFNLNRNCSIGIVDELNKIRILKIFHRERNLNACVSFDFMILTPII